MNARLLPCPSCARHVRAAEHACPFCAADLPLSHRNAGPARVPRTRIGRAAIAAFGAAAIASSGCGDDDGSMSDAALDSAFDSDVSIDAAYGGPPDTGPGDSMILSDVSIDAAYGGPPDTGPGDSMTSDASDGSPDGG